MGSVPKVVNETSHEPLPRQQALDRMLHEGKDSDKESEDDSLVKGRINQGLSSRPRPRRNTAPIMMTFARIKAWITATP